MRLITGDECGLLKEFVPEIAHKKQADAAGPKKSDIILPTQYDNMQNINSQHGMQRVDPNERQARSRGVVSLAMMQDDNDTGIFQFASLRSNGSVQVWQGKRPPGKKNKFGQYQRLSVEGTGDIFKDAKAESCITDKVPAKPLVMHCLRKKNRLVAADTHGNLVILNTAKSEPPSILHQFPALENSPDNITLTYTKGKAINRQLASAMVLHQQDGAVAIGGRERDVRLLDLETGKATWKAKNLPPDPQTLLQQPIWPSALAFWDSNDNSNSHILAAGTAWGQVRLYDVRVPPHQTTSILRRPVKYTPIKDGVHEHRITAIVPLGDGNQIVAGDTTGDLHSLDRRYNFNGQEQRRQDDVSSGSSKSSTGRYVGPSGSIRQLVKHETLPILAAVGCDRMLRTYNTNTQKNIDCVYLKQRLNCVLMCREDLMEEDDDMLMTMTTTRAVVEDEDMDQEDVVQDYVDSDDDEDSDEGSDPQQQGEDEADCGDSSIEADASKLRKQKEASSPDDGSGDSPEEGDGEEESESGSGSDSSGDEEEDESSEDEAPRKRRRR